MTHPPIETIARAIITHGPFVLLCRHAKLRYCYLPGGHVEFGELARDALARELMEEAGERIKVGACVLVEEHAFTQKHKHRHEINLIFEAKLSPAPRSKPTTPPTITSKETGIEFAWIAPRDMRAQRIVPASHARFVARMLGETKKKRVLPRTRFESSFGDTKAP